MDRQISRRKSSTATVVKRRMAPMNNLVYDALLWIFSIVVDLFFREVHPRSSWRIPRKGPVLFVAAPHANQFVDPLILMRVIQREASRRVAFLIAEKSMRRKFVGMAAAMVGAVPVGRALDSTKRVPGKIYLPDPDNDSTLVRGVGTDFEAKAFQIGGLLVLPKVKGAAASAEILEIKSPEEIRLKRAFKGSTALNQLTGRRRILADGQSEEELSKEFEGTSFEVAPKVDQTKVYDAVFERLNDGGCVGIFPEGGSHDRTELLPLKAGVAIMALGALAANPNSDLKIVPCGMNYFHAHKFRSRAVVEFGAPVEVPPELIEQYKSGDRREAVGQLLDIVYQALVAVTVTAPDYETLMLIQAVRRLYNPKGKKLPLPMVVELNRRLVKGYERYKDDPRIVNLKKSVLAYNKQLIQLQIRDHQVEYAKLPFIKVLKLLVVRLVKLVLLAVGVLPGLVLFSPVFIAGKMISIQKSKEALAASTVKIAARDVMATWKVLVSLALAPTLYTFYNIILASWTYKNRINGLVPDFVPLWAVFVFGYIFFPAITFAALRFGEIGMDIVKSLRPLFVALSPAHGNMLVKLRERRAKLASEVTDLINTLGPEMFPDFNATRIIADPFQEPAIGTPQAEHRDVSEPATPTSPLSAGGYPFASFTHGGEDGKLPRKDSYKDLSGVGFFASRPTTPYHARSRSRSNSSGTFPIQGFSSLDSAAGFDEVNRKIRGALRDNFRDRANRRQSQSESRYESGTSTPGSEADAGLTMSPKKEV